MDELQSRRSREERGASAVEYGLLVAGIAAVIMLVVFAYGHMISDTFSNSCGHVAGTITSGGTC